MRRRPRRVVPAIVVALAVLAGSVVVAVSLIQKLSSTRELVSYDDVVTTLRDTEWGSGWVLGAGIAAALAGALLLALALVPGRSVVVPLESEDELDAGIARRSLHAAVRDAAGSVAEVEPVRVRLGRKKIRIGMRTGRAPEDSVAAVRAAVDERLRRVAPGVRREVAAHARPAKEGTP
ncbi:DUF6286 domain-containing protein [Nocardia wallacei]|uniref:DUF6286 domain-containing protein n=1 Tax=Nocardia wallacei TaxID=480035 RepID=UPI0024537D47|nr:DUF6286 domain-containing protein [Nocardia wallacei]